MLQKLHSHVFRHGLAYIWSSKLNYFTAVNSIPLTRAKNQLQYNELKQRKAIQTMNFGMLPIDLLCFLKLNMAFETNLWSGKDVLKI